MREREGENERERERERQSQRDRDREREITQTHKEFENKSNFDELPCLLGEISQCVTNEEQTPL